MDRTIQDDFSKHPVTMYLNGIESRAGKKAMATALRRALALAADDPVQEVGMNQVYQFGWPTVTNDKVLALKNKLIEVYSKATAAQTLSAVKGVMGACFDLGMIDGDHLMRIDRIDGVSVKSDPKVGRYVKPWEMDKLKAVTVQDKTAAGVRDLAIIGLMWHQGIRVSEVCNLDLEDYNQRTGEVLIRHGKGDEPRRNQVHNGAKVAMDDWLERRGEAPGPLFLPIDREGKVIFRKKHLSRWAITKMLEKRQGQAGVEHFSPHDLRRTATTELIEVGGIRKAQKVLGHADISTTARYDRSGQDEALRASSKRSF
jgi:integrase